jgi:hypothetical protein
MMQKNQKKRAEGSGSIQSVIALLLPFFIYRKGGEKMENLQRKIESMIRGEKKRREVAIRFLDVLSNELKTVGIDIWGSRASEESAVWMPKCNIYFRYMTHEGKYETEKPGFYFSEGEKYWGWNLQGIRGEKFWGAIRGIIDWLPFLAQEIERREISREKLSERLKKMLGE